VSLTMEESLALAVLQGDRVAAWALVDRLIEERERGGRLAEATLAALHPNPPGFPLGRDVYHWPEFRAFCRRLGLVWEIYTTGLVIRLDSESHVEIEHYYRGGDQGPEPGAPEIDGNGEEM
jgi:hypothetical protein